jgi:hypothetical protein
LKMLIQIQPVKGWQISLLVLLRPTKPAEVSLGKGKGAIACERPQRRFKVWPSELPLLGWPLHRCPSDNIKRKNIC